MRKRIALLLAVLLALLCGCSGESAVTETTEAPSVLESAETTAATEETQSTEETARPRGEATEATEPEPELTDFVLIQKYIPTARVELAYATPENFTGTAIYPFQDAYLRYGTVLKLMHASVALENMGYGIVIWDAFRPVYAQEQLWQAYPDPAYVSQPGTGTQSHCRGSAVDITLFDLTTGELLTMPTGFDDFTKLADRNYADVPREAAENATLLQEVMAKYGFTPYGNEWWHFTDTDSYDIEYNFDPAFMN